MFRCCFGAGDDSSSGGAHSNNANEDAIAAQLELQLLQDKLQNLFRFKVLVLGAGESGKSTVLKAIKLIHKGKMELTPDEKERMVLTLHENVHTCLKAILDGADKLGIPLNDPDNIRIAQAIRAVNPATEKFIISPEVANDYTYFWHSDEIQATWARRSEYWNLDACPYYLANLPRFAEPDFVPTEEDNLMARVRTTGIVVNEFEMRRPDAEPDEPETVQYQIVDVGGQRNERRKWIHSFDNVSCIIFVVSLAGVDQVLFEDNSKKRIYEDLELFQSITSRPAFQDTPIFLFLNKKDLFESMIQSKDLSAHFPEYTGGKNLMAAMEYITSLFKARAPAGKEFATSFVSARVKKDIQYAFEDVKRHLYQSNTKAIEVEKAALKRAQRKMAASAGKSASNQI